MEVSGLFANVKQLYIKCGESYELFSTGYNATLRVYS